jgi:hypothetical protein
MASRVLIVKNRNRYLFWIAEIDRVIQEIATSGTASASLSSSGGSKTYSRLNLRELRELRAVYVSRVNSLDMALAAFPNTTGIRHVTTVRSGAWQC